MARAPPNWPLAALHRLRIAEADLAHRRRRRLALALRCLAATVEQLERGVGLGEQLLGVPGIGKQR